MGASHACEIEPVGRDGWVEVGRVLRPHGLHGELMLSLHGDDAGNLSRAERVRLRGRPGRIDFDLVSVQPAGPAVRTERADPRARVALAGLGTREQAKSWSGAEVQIPESALEPLPDGEYYWRDLIGLECHRLNGEALGKVEEIWSTGSNDVLVVRGSRGTLLVPALRDVLVRIELGTGSGADKGTVWIDPPPGLGDPS